MKLYGLDISTQWDEICELHVLKLAELYHPDWYRWRLTNNYERAVFLKGDGILPRESARYRWASEYAKGDVFEVGCSTGYGSQFLNYDEYTGLDYDPVIVQVAKEQDWSANAKFINANINTIDLDYYDTIIAFEVIEHLENGLEVVEKLKRHCSELLISVPHNEPVGFWGEHHKLHGLNESHFQNAEFSYIDEHGAISNMPSAINETNRCNLMLCRL